MWRVSQVYSSLALAQALKHNTPQNSLAVQSFPDSFDIVEVGKGHLA